MIFIRVIFVLCSLGSPLLGASSSLPPMLDLTGVGKDPTLIDYNRLPVLRGDHALITKGPSEQRGMEAVIFDLADVNAPSKWNFRLHSYLAHVDGNFWAMWSHGRQARIGRLPVPVTPQGGVFDPAHTSGSVQYPHVIEHDGNLLICYSRLKIGIEVIKVSLDEVERLRTGKL